MPRDRSQSFRLTPGDLLADDYLVKARIGRGLEGEVYRVKERRTGVDRAAKLFFPERNPRNRAARFYAKKLDRLRDCPIVIQYHHSTTVDVDGRGVTCMFSDFVEGELLYSYVKRQQGARLTPFAALHLIYGLARGLEFIHRVGEYHGDIHDENVLIRQRGIFFDVKLVDFYNCGEATAAHRRDDVANLIRMLYDLIGGKPHYAAQPTIVKAVVKGLRRDLIEREFPTVRHLREFLESDAL